MASIPISLRNVPRSPFKRRQFSDISGAFVPHVFITEQLDPLTGRVNKISYADFGERDIWPSYPTNLLQRPAAYGKTPESGW